ncbi:MAG: hypothetical protein WD603_01690 [Patescibacteria group bacterium]
MILAGATMELIGSLMIAYAALAVHYRVRKEHRIDDRVQNEMGREFGIGVSGMVLVLAGYLLQLPGHF